MPGPEFVEKTGVAPGTTTLTLGDRAVDTTDVPVALHFLRVVIIADALAAAIAYERAAKLSTGLPHNISQLARTTAERDAVRANLTARKTSDGAPMFSDAEIDAAFPPKPSFWKRKKVWGALLIAGAAAGAYVVVTRRHRAAYPEQYEWEQRTAPSAPRGKWDIQPVQPAEVV
jgi:hypothetical protein